MEAKIKEIIQKDKYRVPFVAAVVMGLLTHFYMLVNKFPNADAMTNFYFDQNMVTSGRWFLGTVCGISSFYDLNWVIGVLSILYLAITAVLISEFFELQTNSARIVTAGLLVSFPAITATYAYMYTMDGYMLGLILAVVAAYLAKKYKYGFAFGGVALAFSLGIYQAYVAVTILLCMFWIILLILQNASIKEIWARGWRFLAMGVEGGVLYYVILKICLAVQGKELDTYQGLDGMGKISFATLPKMIYNAYYDFAVFAVKGNIFVNNGFSLVSMLLLLLMAFLAVVLLIYLNRTYRKWYQIVLLLLFVAILPLGTNIILLISAEAYYHLLMRLQWILYPIFCVVLVEYVGRSTKLETHRRLAKTVCILSYVMLLGAGISIYNFAVTDNIAYFNMNERYEKTYAYCLRLADRIEQTEGYEPGMPVAMIGVINEDNYPNTDITEAVTARISGTTGSMLIYKGEQYAAFMKHYLNITIYPIVGDEIIEIYNSEEYQAMESFPAENSICIVDGTMYIKTE